MRVRVTEQTNLSMTSVKLKDVDNDGEGYMSSKRDEDADIDESSDSDSCMSNDSGDSGGCTFSLWQFNFYLFIEIWLPGLEISGCPRHPRT